MLGEKIKAYRESKKMTQKDIAEILEVEPGTISKYECKYIRLFCFILYRKIVTCFDRLCTNNIVNWICNYI